MDQSQDDIAALKEENRQLRLELDKCRRILNDIKRVLPAQQATIEDAVKKIDDLSVDLYTCLTNHKD